MTTTIHEIIASFESSIDAMRHLFNEQNDSLQHYKALAVTFETDCGVHTRAIAVLDRACKNKDDTIKRLEEEIATLEDQNTIANRSLDEQSNFDTDRRAVLSSTRALRNHLDELIAAIG